MVEIVVLVVSVGPAIAHWLTQLRPGPRNGVLGAGTIAKAPADRSSGFMISLPLELTRTGYVSSGANDAQPPSHRLCKGCG